MLFKKVFNNFICFIIHLYFFISLNVLHPLPMSLEKIKLIAYDTFQVWLNFIRVFFDLLRFISIAMTFTFNIINARKIYSNWFFIILSLLFKKGLKISNYFGFDCLIFFFLVKNLFCLQVVS